MNRLTTRPIIGLALLTTCAMALLSTAATATVPKRVLELVNIPDKNGNPVVGGAISPDGERALYTVFGGVEGGQYGSLTPLVARRTEAGWKSVDVVPPRASMPGEDMGLFALGARLDMQLLARPTLGNPGVRTLVKVDAATSGARVGYAIRNPAAITQDSIAISDDADHVFMTFGAPLVPGDTSISGSLYDVGSGRADLVGLLPGDVLPPCGVRQGVGEFAENANAIPSQHWTSSDGNRVFFHAGDGACDEPSNLYMREGGADGNTTLISGPPVAGPDLGGRFSQATPDGMKVFFTTASRLSAADTNMSPDIYRFTLGAGTHCVTCVVADADVVTQSPPPASNSAELLTVSEDGSHVYFVSTRNLAEGGRDGELNIYLWRDSDAGRLAYVAPSSGLGDANAAMTSEDGGVLVFRANVEALNDLTASDNGGFSQFYRYEDASRGLSCVSCPKAGRATRDVPVNPQSAVVSSGVARTLVRGGRTFFFRTHDPLVPRDVNGALDIYEWSDDELSLITDGRTAWPFQGEPQIFGATEDGRDFLFGSYGEAAGALEQSAQLFDARVDGGFPAAEVSKPACIGDACQGDSGAVPNPSSLGSSTLTAPPADRQVRVPTRARRLRLEKVSAGEASIVVRMRVPGRGRLSVVGKGFASVSKTVTRAGLVSVKAKLNSRARRIARAKGSIGVRLRITFRPAAGAPASVTTNVTVGRSR